jgi:O-antigen/teichoic acid export membrane protein
MLLLPWIAANFEGPTFGSYSLFMLLTTLLNTFLLMGIDQSVFRFLPEKHGAEKDKLLGAALLLVTLAGIAGMLIFLFWGNLLNSLLFNSDRGIRAFDLPAIAFLLSLDSLFFTALKAEKRTGLYAGIFSLKSIIYYTALIIGILRSPDSGAFVFAYYLSSGIILIIFIPLFFKKISFPDSTQYKQLLRFGLPMLGTILTGILLNQADHFLIRHFLSLEAVGDYHFSYKYAWASGMMIIILNQVWLPRLFAEGESYFERTFTTINKLALPAVGLIFLLTYRILLFLQQQGIIPQEYHIQSLFPILGTAFIFYAGIQMIDSILLLRKKVTFLNRIYSAVLIFNLAANYYLIPRYGIDGAAAATAVSFFFILTAITLYTFSLYSNGGKILSFIIVISMVVTVSLSAIITGQEIPVILALIIYLILGISGSIKGKKEA